MRISEFQKNTIIKIVHTFFVNEVNIFLFGSRTDSFAKGGDIDILIESENPIENPADVKAKIITKLKMALGDQHIDLLLSAPNLQHKPIHDIAKKNGIPL